MLKEVTEKRKLDYTSSKISSNSPVLSVSTAILTNLGPPGVAAGPQTQHEAKEKFALQDGKIQHPMEHSTSQIRLFFPRIHVDLSSAEILQVHKNLNQLQICS